MVIIPVSVEKLARQEFAEIASRQEALQTIFPPRLDIFYHPNFGFLQEKRVFQHPPLFSTLIWKNVPIPGSAFIGLSTSDAMLYCSGN
jgi:hypothetical protein